MEERPKRKAVFCRICCFQTTHELIDHHWVCCLCKSVWTLRFARIADEIQDWRKDTVR